MSADLTALARLPGSAPFIELLVSHVRKQLAEADAAVERDAAAVRAGKPLLHDALRAQGRREALMQFIAALTAAVVPTLSQYPEQP